MSLNCFMRSIVFFLITMVGVSANAQTVEFKLHVDNNGQGRGCEVNLSNLGTTLQGVDVEITATVDRPSKTITGLSLASCDGGSFGSATALSAGIPLGLDNGVNGSDVLELPLPLKRLWRAPQVLELYFSSYNPDSGAQDLVGTDGPGQQAVSTPFYVAYGIPTVGVVGLITTGVLLLGFGLLVLRRKQYLLAISLLSLSSVCFAINFIADGLVGDWDGHGPNAGDAAGDVSPPDPTADIQAVFLALENGTLFARIDVADLENVAPEADAGKAKVLEDDSVEIILTGSDADGDPLSFAIVDAPTYGSLGAVTPIDATSASVVYTPDPDYNGLDSFTFKANDSIADSAPAGIDISVIPVNDAPKFTAGADQSVDEDAGAQSVGAWATGIIAGPANESAQGLSFQVSNDNNALFAVQPAVNAAGDLSYTPADDANGQATVTIAVMDDGGTDNGGVDTAPSQTFTITVNAVNDEPSFTAGADQEVLEDAGVQTVAGWATDISAGPDDEIGQVVSFLVKNDNTSLFAVQPAVDSAGELSYTPADDANGVAVVTIGVMDDGGTANGGDDTSDPQTFSITVTAVNDEPKFTAGGDEVVNEDAGAQSVAGWATDIAAGPADEVAQQVTFDVSNDNNSLFSAQPGINSAGDLSYTPADDANGVAQVTVAIMDDGGTADGGVDTSPTQTFTITVNAVNDEPEFSAGPNPELNEDAGPQTIASWASIDSLGPPDESAQTVTFSTINDNNGLFVSQPVIDPSGMLSFTAADDANGSATLSIEMVDSGGTANGGDDTSVTKQAVITVNAVNDKPSFVGGADETVDQDAGLQSVSGWATGISAGPANESTQTVSFNAVNDSNALFSGQPAVDGAGTLTYTPAPGAFGSATVSVEAMDDGGTANGGVDTSDPQTFKITVIPSNRAPELTAIGDLSIDELTELSFTAQATDPDLPAQTLTFSLSGEPAGAGISAAGAFSWTPTEAQGMTGPGGMYTFDVIVTDNANPALSDSETITVTVNEVNQNPLAVDDAYAATGNVSISLASGSGLITGDSDPDLPAQPLTFTPETVSSANGGTAMIAGDGSFTYDPPAGFTGQDTFSYTVNDDMSGSAVGEVTITVSDMIWFVDNSLGSVPVSSIQAVPDNMGTLAAPFHALADLEAVNGNGGTAPAAGQCIFIDNNAATAYNGPVTLEDGQVLVGKGSDIPIAAECGITLAANSAALPSTGGTRPVINSTAMGIVLASNNKVRGLNLGNTNLYGISGNAVGSPQISLVSILGAGAALGISNGGDLGGVTFDTLECANATSLPCLNIAGADGTLGITSGGLGLNYTGTAHAVVVSGGTLNFNYPAPIIKTFDANSTVVVVNGHTGTLTFSGTVTGNGGNGLRFENADGNYVFSDTVTLNGGDAGIDILLGSQGTFTFASAASEITNPTGVALNIDNSAAMVTFPGSITKNNNASTAVSVVNNASTVTLGGMITASTTTANAFVVKGGGTIIATGADNTIVTTTGTAVEIDGTTIGVGGVRFRSVSVDGAASGIFVNNAGNGGFTITGDGSTAASGGTIQNISGRGIDIQSTDNISLAYMTLTDTALVDGPIGQCSSTLNTGCTAAIHLETVTTATLDNINVDRTNQMGINGLDVTGLTLRNSVVSNAGDGANEGALQVFDLKGTSSIMDSVLSLPSERVGYIKNSSGTLDLTVDGSTFSDTQSSGLGADGLEVSTNAGAVVNLTITDSSFLRNRTNGLQVLAQGFSTVKVKATGSTFDREAGIGIGMDLSAVETANLDFDVSNNPVINGRNGNAFNSFVAGSSTTNGRLDNNPDIQVGGELTPGMGVRLNLNESANASYDVSGNTISNIGADAGIQALSRGGNGRLDATIGSNSVAVHPGFFNSLYNIWVQAQDGNTTCGNVTGNTNTGNPIAAFRERTSDAGSTVLLQGFNTDVITTWTNNLNTPPSVQDTNAGTLAGGTCNLVPTAGFPFQ